MSAHLAASDKNTLQIMVTVKLDDSMMTFEEQLQQSLNEAGKIGCGEELRHLDTNGLPVTMGGVRMTSKRKKEPKVYETVWGAVRVERHVYQTREGGKTFCPLDQKARIIVNSTPCFARMVSWKYAQMAASQVVEDLRQHHGRPCSGSTLRDIANVIGSIAQAKEEDWNYDIPTLPRPVATITLGLDGTTVLYYDGYREAMCGTIALYDDEGQRMHTIYCACAPEYGKATFLRRFREQIEKVKQRYPEAVYVGIADGAPENWRFLESLTSVKVLDFYHMSEYVANVADALFPKENQAPERFAWLKQKLHELKHKPGSARQFIRWLETRPVNRRQKRLKDKLSKALTYFRNHREQMIYPAALAESLPIGSGVTEAACKTLVKRRLGQSGMRWKEQGASMLLTLRALICSSGHWDSFWKKMNRYGFPVCHNLIPPP